MKFNYKSWCKLFNVLSVRWCIQFYDVFVFFCCFTAAQSNVIHLYNTWNVLWMKTPGMNYIRLDGHITRFKMAENFCFQIFLHHFVQKIKVKLVDRTFTKPKINSSWKSFCHWIPRENWWTWTEVMYKAKQTFWLSWFISPCFIKLGLLRLCIFCVVMQITS